ncbi:MAG: helix-hairpin-helix domain-containing protein [candidate division Zixibacteria bacterium]|nr:helix-hairpin-helix domain-containing protein [candidate division Zixibacteria bacterium]
MNRFFDFTDTQLKFVVLLCATAMIMGGYLLIRSYAYPSEDAPQMGVFLESKQGTYTGVFVLDPNTAPADSLELIPGIGPVLADRIVNYRQLGQFKTMVDIMQVSGIGPKTYERIKPYLRIASR